MAPSPPTGMFAMTCAAFMRGIRNSSSERNKLDRASWVFTADLSEPLVHVVHVTVREFAERRLQACLRDRVGLAR